MRFIIKFFVAIFVMIVLDYLWLQFYGAQHFVDNASGLLRVTSEALSFNYIGAFIAYALMSLSIILFVLPKAGDSISMAFIWGAVMGAIIYGVFNCVNLADLKGWTQTVSIADTLWGMCLLAVTSSIVEWVRRY